MAASLFVHSEGDGPGRGPAEDPVRAPADPAGREPARNRTAETPRASGAGAVVALKPFHAAKSRLDLPDELRRALVAAMALDTVRALAAVLDEVLVVGGPDAVALFEAADVPGCRVILEPPSGGLNPAFRYGEQVLRSVGRLTVVAAVGDLPALRPSSVRHLLDVALGAWADGPGRGFLADREGMGTTLLIARGSALEPRFEAGSAAAHRASGAIPLVDAGPGAPLDDARTDVDTLRDLRAARRLGLGPATTAALAGRAWGQDPADLRLPRRGGASTESVGTSRSPAT